MQLMAAAGAGGVRGGGMGGPAAHGRHPSLAGLPLHHHGMDQQAAFAGMAAAMGHRGINPHGLPKLETHGINNLDFTASGLRTAPPIAVFNNEFDLDNMFYTHGGNTINPNALHYNDSPQSMAIDSASPFAHPGSGGLHDLSGSQQVDDGLDWLTGFDAHMSFGGANENAVDGSSPSAISTTSQSGMSDVMVDGSNHHPVTSAGPLWQQAALMGPPQPTGPFGLDMHAGHPHTSVFPDLMVGTPVSPQVSQRGGGAMSDNYFSTPPPSITSLSPNMLSSFTNAQNLGAALGFGNAPETPPSTNGSINGSSPVSTITDVTRNAIMAALAQCSQYGVRRFSSHSLASPTSPTAMGFPTMAGNLSDSFKNLPSTANLQRYVAAYIRYFHPHLPFLHIATLNFEVPSTPNGRLNPVGGSTTLVLSMAAIGALYELEHDRSRELFEMAKKMIQLYLEERRKADLRNLADFRRNPANEHSGDGAGNTPVWLIQAMLLNIIYGHNCGDKTAGDIASTHCTALVSLAKSAHLCEDSSDTVSAASSGPDVKMSDPDLAYGLGLVATDAADEQAEWIRWKTAEERKRTLYAVFILSSMLVSAYNHTPALTNTEIRIDLPCDEEFFAAESASVFASRGGARGAAHNRIRFNEALGRLLRASTEQQLASSGINASGDDGASQGSKSELRPSTFGCLVLINALHNYIWETRQRHHNKVWTNEETEKMHRHIEPALKAWQAAWSANPKHSLERPNPYGKGPLSADAIPLLDLAYVRLFVNLSSSKEKFWSRDWDGMADELAHSGDMVPVPAGPAPAQQQQQQQQQVGNAAEHQQPANALSSPSSTSNTESAGTGTSTDLDISGAIVDSPATTHGSVSPKLPSSNGPAAAQTTTGSTTAPNGTTTTSSTMHSGNSSRTISRRERHLRRAAFYAADSLAMSDKLGVTFADFSSRELPLQSAMCAFDCAQVLAEWAATLQDRVGRYLGILGQGENVDFGGVPAIMLLEEEDIRLLAKVQEVLEGAEMKMNLELVSNGSLNSIHDLDAHARLQMDEHVGYAAKILRVTAYMLGKAAVWPGEFFPLSILK